MACPGLAFSENFFRLGRGKGYYDKYIYNCHCQQCQPFLVGLAFNEQMTGTNLSLSESDQQLSLILYPDFYTNRRHNSGETKRQLRPIFRYTFPDDPWYETLTYTVSAGIGYFTLWLKKCGNFTICGLLLLMLRNNLNSPWIF